MVRVLPMVLLCGCHWILPLDGAADPSGADGAVDLSRVDSVVDSVVDAGDTPPVPVSQVNCACASKTDDCDGLPPERDIEPGVCNELLWEDTFAADPLTSKEWRVINGAWSWDPGWFSQSDTDNPDQSDRYYWAIKELSAAVDPHYLVEARLVLGAMPNPDFWQAGIVARVSQFTTGPDQLPEDFIACVARVDRVADTCAQCTSPGGYVVNPDLRVEARAGGEDPWFGAWPLDNPAALYHPEPGEVIILQLWFRPVPGEIHCRVFQAGSLGRDAWYEMWGRSAEHLKHLPVASGSVGFRTWERGASFDYIRVFQLHQNGS